MDTLNAAGQRRLDRLRRSEGSKRYLWDGPSWGSDDSRTISLCVDPTGWVVDAQVGEIGDDLRDPETLEAAVRQAYGAADLTRMLNSSILDGNVEEKARRGQELLDGKRRIVAPKVSPWVRPSMPTAPISMPATAFEVPSAGVYVGTSREDEISVRIRVGNGCAAFRVDAAWLRTTTPALLRFALKEAFAAATQQGESA